MASNSNGLQQSLTFNNYTGPFNVVFASMTSETITYSPLQHQQAIFAFVISALLNILQLKPHSPFDAHPKLMKMAVILFFLYCFGCIVESRITVGTDNPLARHSFSDADGNVMHRIVRLFGYFLLASLTSILLYSDSIWLLLFLVFAFSVMGMLLHWLLMHCKVLNGRSNLHNNSSRTGLFQVPLAVISTHPV